MLQSSFSTHNIDLRCPQGNKPTKKEEKTFGKNKSTDSAFANTFSGKQSSFTQQTSSANPKKDGSRHCKRQRQGCHIDSSATGVNIVPKKEERDMS